MPHLMRLGQVLIDLTLFAAAFAVSYLLRYDFSLPFQVFKQLLFQLPYVVGLEYGLLMLFGAHRVVWRFVSAADVITLARPLLIANGVLVSLRLVAPHLGFGHRIYLTIPFGVIAINLALGVLAVLGTRITRRLWTEARNRSAIDQPTSIRRLLLVGAGEAGVLVAKEVQRRPDLGLQIVGFVDDNRAKWGTRIAGLPVLAGLDSLGHLIREMHVDDVVISIAGAASSTVRQVLATCEEADVKTKIVPGLYEIIGGHVSVSRLRDVEIEDLLGRDAVRLDTAKMSGFLEGKIIAVTGAGGSIGSELCRQIAAFNPGRLLLIERAEHALFEIHSELKSSFSELLIEPCLADVANEERLRSVLTRFGCHVLFHAAAHKHVPMLEWNPTEAVRNNVFGTKCAADLAAELGVEHFVLISTDKAINPTSVMGASKRVAELYVQAMGQQHKATRFSCVRFGNVLGSAGSVVPIFKKQIAQGGPISVTHPEMVRYFMTIPEASQLVLEAATLGSGGEVFILDMGKPVKIVDLARDLIRLSGLKPDQDIQITFSGIRPGEKLFEELATDDEKAERTSHGKIFIGRVRSSELGVLNAALADLRESMLRGPREVYSALRKLIPEFSGQQEEALEGSQVVDAMRMPL